MVSSYKIFNDDAFILLDKMANEKLIVDAIITDPPYNISKENNFTTMKNAKSKV
jgi:DNA (cytosine-5)-methyltransferase 1/site-specific DNA-methyltransferase (adenine-specific)